MDKPLRRITVGKPLLQVDDHEARLSVLLQLPHGPTELWFSVPAADAHKLSEQTCDGFVVAMYAFAAVRGLDMRVEGPLSARLAHALNGPCGALLATLIPGARQVRVLAETLCTTNWGGSEAFTGFSGGIDSYCTLLSYSQRDVLPELKLSGLFFNDVGSRGPSRTGANAYPLRRRRMHALASQLGLPLVSVSSNLDAILGLPFRHTHTLRHVAVALLFQRVCSTFLYSSLVHYRDARARDVPDVGYADSMLLPLLRTETVTCMSVGGEHTRFDKTRLVSQYSPSYFGLDVCESQQSGDRNNCSVCWKCLRTQLTLEMLGSLELYAGVFALDRYRRCRSAYIASVLQSEDALLREIREQIQARGFLVPQAARWLQLLPAPALRLGLRRYAQRCAEHDAAATQAANSEHERAKVAVAGDRSGRWHVRRPAPAPRAMAGLG